MKIYSRPPPVFYRKPLKILLLFCGMALAAPGNADRGATQESAPPSGAGELGITHEHETQAGDTLFRNDSLLSAAALVRVALERNPGLEAMRQQWEAAKAVEPQARAWEDPMFSAATPPASWGEDRVGYNFMLSQTIPFPGKKRLAGSAARQRAQGAEKDLEDMRLELAVEAVELFGEYYRLHRSLDINREFLELWERHKASARARYRAGIGSPQDPLQAEAGRIRTGLDVSRFEAKLEGVRARINALLHRPQKAPLPPPPLELSVPREGPEAGLRRAHEQDPQAAGFPDTPEDTSWLLNHPEYQAVEARIRAARLSEDLARRSRWPDLQVSAQRNVMWMDPDMQNMIGISAMIPLQWGRRNAQVTEVRARRKALEQSHHRHVDGLLAEAWARRAEVAEAEKWPTLYRDTLLPVLEARVDAAHTGYKTGRNDFFTLIQAEKALRETRLAYHVALAAYQTRRARLAVALGRLPYLENTLKENGENP